MDNDKAILRYILFHQAPAMNENAIKLHLGCGLNHIPSWINMDIDSPVAEINIDLSGDLPYEDESVDFIYAEHFIEHMTRADGLALLKECNRILKPTGILRLSTPNLAYLVEVYLTKDVQAWGDLWQPGNACNLLNEAFRLWGHQYLYDWDAISDALKSAGLPGIRRARWRESAVADLRNLECRPFHFEIILEATKCTEFYERHDEVSAPSLNSESNTRQSAARKFENQGSTIDAMRLEAIACESKENRLKIDKLLGHIKELEEDTVMQGENIKKYEKRLGLCGDEKSQRPTISIVLITYNHEKYIDKALDGLFFQAISGWIEVVVADDFSKDNTLAKIKSRAQSQDRFDFVFLESSENVGITKNYQRAFAACKGQYVAVLEGDDYWISPKKLENQVNYLEEHLEVGLCSSNYYVFNQHECRFTTRCPTDGGVKTIGARDLIFDNIVGNFSTCMYRGAELQSLPPAIFELKAYDWIVNICIAKNSLIAFLPQPLSIYRVHSGGEWSKSTHIDKLKLQLSLLFDYDRVSGGVFHDEFLELSSRLQQSIAVLETERVVEMDPILIQKSLPGLVRLAMSPRVKVLRAMIPEKFKRFIRQKIEQS